MSSQLLMVSAFSPGAAASGSQALSGRPSTHPHWELASVNRRARYLRVKPVGIAYRQNKLPPKMVRPSRYRTNLRPTTVMALIRAGSVS